MTWKSGLEQYPEHARIIGMISIENANLELALADLLAATLQISRRVAHAIYFTPRAATLRLQILEAAAKARLALRGNARSPSEIESQKRDALQRIGRIVKRCLSHVQKRHNVIHDAWEIGTFHEGERVQGVVFRQRIDTALHFRDFEVVKIEDLQGLLDGFRHLIDDARSLTANLRARPPTMADLRKS